MIYYLIVSKFLFSQHLAQGFNYWISRSYRMGISHFRYLISGRYLGYTRILGVYIGHYIKWNI